MVRALGYSESLMHNINVNTVVSIETMNDVDAKELNKTLNHLQQLNPILCVYIEKVNDQYFFMPCKKGINLVVVSDKVNFDHLLDSELNYTFSPKAPLFRALLIKAHQKNIIILNFSHTISDAQSILGFAKTLVENYGKDCNNPLQNNFPDPVEHYCKPLLLGHKNAPKLNLDGGCNKNKFKRKIHFTLDNILTKNSLSGILAKYNSTSLTSIFSACLLKNFSELIKNADITRYLTVDLRQYLNLGYNQLAYYGVGLPENYHDLQHLNLIQLINNIDLKMYSYLRNLNFIKKALLHDSLYQNVLSVSFLGLININRSDSSLTISNIKFFGNVYYFKNDINRFFILISLFNKLKLNCAIHYDTRIVPPSLATCFAEHTKMLLSEICR